ncbi:hypothetical protein K450DRAFT_249208 [Umbelopsis ramanniana AG]|uniref:Stress response protein NST1 n=1 Tax=Umbelopsis ramanniana AG TaxID=1314678 RepID=A0AAD5E7X3_UMBRA|nr:uncharacterized protein K450DRAFT_249208 [Umbelopsis ramanniana AG]KAI8577955.1 hypothetical protein K450DRAFT_249208 [Umbelopsis ramanniana AG]
MTMQRLVETAQGTSAGMTESMTENSGLVNARALRNGKSKKKKKKSVNKSNLGSPHHDASAAVNDDDDDHPIESIHSQDLSSRQQFDDMPNATSNKRKKKKKKSKSSAMESIDNQVTHSQPSALHSHNLTLPYKSDNDSRTKFSGDNIWSSNNNSEERQRIREFWLQLGEDERRSLVKVEKEAVLKKMKEQQKHSCNCSVCGKKRTAIEEELEILYDAYYEELEQYANHQQSNHGYGIARSLQDGYASMRTDAALVDAYANQILASKNPLDHQDDYDDEDDEDEDEDDEDDDDEDDDDDEYDGDYDDEDLSSRHGEHMMGNGDHFNFGNSLTVKGGILTVADDLLKNDGKKFLDMMERLAERRMQREEEAGLDQDEYYDDDDEDDDAYEDEVDEVSDDDANGLTFRRMMGAFYLHQLHYRIP